MGFVRRLILALSRKSNLLAHQLIWNIRTNTFKNETTPDNEMQKKLEPIAEQIETDLTPDAKKFYERVFTFSDRLTKVSDIIKVYPKGNERKEGRNVKQMKEFPLGRKPRLVSHIPKFGDAILVHWRYIIAKFRGM
jgi:hypothetical protein